LKKSASAKNAIASDRLHLTLTDDDFLGYFPDIMLTRREKMYK